jgi:hypothetical protein
MVNQMDDCCFGLEWERVWGTLKAPVACSSRLLFCRHCRDEDTPNNNKLRERADLNCSATEFT